MSESKRKEDILMMMKKLQDIPVSIGKAEMNFHCLMMFCARKSLCRLYPLESGEGKA